MKRYGLGYLGAGAALICFSMAGAALAQDISPPGRPTQQELQEIRSTYIVQFSASVSPSEVAGRANAIAARFNGVVTNTYDTALKGFAIRMNDRALTNMIRTTGLDIISVSRDAPVTAYAPGGKKGKPTKPGGGGSCGETLGWDIKRITTMTQNSYGKNDPDSCNVVSSASLDYSGSGLKVCVIDTGVSPHEDLNVDATLGQNFSNDKGGTEDLNGHGSHVAGTIGAKANNDIGVVGVAPGAVIIPIKVLNRRGSGSFAGVIDGVDHAAKIGCDIANMSLGGETPSTALDDAVKGARSAGVIFTLAAGNSAEDVATHTPARASDGPDDNIFTIASFGQDSAGADLWSYFSNYDAGPTKAGFVDFVLPGGAIKSTWLDDGYNTISGTSMAAPHMAGLLVRLGAAAKGDVSNAAFDAGGSVQRIDYYTKIPSESYNVASDDGP